MKMHRRTSEGFRCLFKVSVNLLNDEHVLKQTGEKYAHAHACTHARTRTHTRTHGTTAYARTWLSVHQQLF